MRKDRRKMLHGAEPPCLAWGFSPMNFFSAQPLNFGQPHRHLSVCDSTNDIAREWASETVNPAPSGALVSADFQTRGRGQRGHQWQADAGQSALLSYVYRLPPATDTAQLSLLIPLAVAEALAACGVSPQIKWPNDILLSGKKCGGILVEVAAGVAVLGIGLNVGQTEFAGAAEFVYPPTSLRLTTGREHAVKSIVDAVSASLTHWEERWRREGILPVFTAYGKRLAIGAVVRRGEEQAALAGISAGGQAIVQLSDGTFAAWTTVS